jgi:glycosyltransferase involved in cell wall biosynthesis
MRIGLDGYPLSEALTGVGHYTLELALALARNFPADKFQLVSPKPFHSSVIARTGQQSLPNLELVQPRSTSVRGHWWSVGLPLYARRAAFDLFHGTNYELPLWNQRRTVLTIHDLSTLIYPKLHRARLARRARMRLPLAARSANAIVTPTGAIRQDVCRHLKINPAKVTAIHEAPREFFQPIASDESEGVRQRLGVEDNFILFVGTLEPRKNLLSLLKAFVQVLEKTDVRPQLVIAGGEGWLIDDTLEFARSSTVARRLRFAGYLNDEELRALYSSCRAFIYPSLYEGFGLPPLEAMACGAPVIAGRIPALQEVLGDTALLVEPLDVDTLGRRIVELMQSERRRNELTVAGRKRAAEFSWDQAARQTYALYQHISNANC